MHRRAVRACSLLLVLATGGVPIAVADEPADLLAPERVQRGHEAFGESCSYCHGENGAGGATGAPGLQGRTDLSAADLFETITNGRISGMNIMPAWGESLSEEQRWALVAYIRSLAGDAK
jgi:mono/diheme cytochrome c family protein